MLFSNEIYARGTILPSVSGSAVISTLVPGRVKKIHHTVGDRVEMGEPLFALESYEIILLQQEYAEVFHQLKQLSDNYHRQKSLSDEKIVALKDFLRTESEYKTMLAKANGLKARLRMIHIDPSTVQNGTIVPYFTVRAPIGGIVTRLELVIGQFVEPQVTVMEIVDPQRLQLNLNVFEKDLTELAVGQSVEFYTPDREELIHHATVSHTGKAIDPETKTVDCIAQLDPDEKGIFVNNLYMEARIITCQREARAVSEQALMREPERDFIWIMVGETEEQITFRKVPVLTGVTRQGFTEILDDDLADVLLEGAYNLWSED